MAVFSVIGTVTPFLHVSLAAREKIFAEAGAMVSMDTTLDLTASARGGLFSSLVRSFANDESFFQQIVTASRGPGDILLAPVLPGGIEVLEVGRTQYLLNDSVFLAAEDSVSIVNESQGFTGACFGGTGGFVVGKTSGSGKVAIAGFGDIYGLDVSPDADVIVDNVHVVAWDSALSYDVSVSTSNAGLFKRMFDSAASGEGVVNRFKGKGKVYVCSRNKQSFAGWMLSCIRPR